MTLQHQEEVHSYSWSLSNVPGITEPLFLDVTFYTLKKQVTIAVRDKHERKEWINDHYWTGEANAYYASEFKFRTLITDIHEAAKLLVQKSEAHFR